MYSDRAFLAKLLFGFVYLSNELNEAQAWFWDSLFWPVIELEQSDSTWLSILLKLKYMYLEWIVATIWQDITGDWARSVGRLEFRI